MNARKSNARPWKEDGVCIARLWPLYIKPRSQTLSCSERKPVRKTLTTYNPEKVLITLGFSRNRVKALRGELTFNTFLNIVLPLSLTRSETRRIEDHIRKVDVLRKIRNDIVHGNIREEDIDENNVQNGIEGALVVVAFIRRKIAAT